MSLVQTLRNVFPSGSVKRVVPKSDIKFEVALPKGALPENCEVVMQATVPYAPLKGTLRQYFLVKTEKFMLFFQMRDDSDLEDGFEMAASLGGASLNDDEAVAELQFMAQQHMQLQPA